MARTAVVGSGPVEFVDVKVTPGQQLLIPLSDLFFDNGTLVASDWPLYHKHKDAVDALLKYLVESGALTRAPEPPPSAAMVVTAQNAGASGNNIEVTVSNSETADQNDATRFDSEVREADIFVHGVERNAVNGNVVVNEQKPDGTSLSVVPGGPAEPNIETAVTGNVFHGNPMLPLRNLPAPLDNWYVFNAIS